MAGRQCQATKWALLYRPPPTSGGSRAVDEWHAVRLCLPCRLKGSSHAASANRLLMHSSGQTELQVCSNPARFDGLTAKPATAGKYADTSPRLASPLQPAAWVHWAAQGSSAGSDSTAASRLQDSGAKQAPVVPVLVSSASQLREQNRSCICSLPCAECYSWHVAPCMAADSSSHHRTHLTAKHVQRAVDPAPIRAGYWTEHWRLAEPGGSLECAQPPV